MHGKLYAAFHVGLLNFIAGGKVIADSVTFCDVSQKEFGLMSRYEHVSRFSSHSQT